MNQVCITNTPDLHTQAAQGADRKSPPEQQQPPATSPAASSVGQNGGEDSSPWHSSTNLGIFTSNGGSASKWHPHVYANPPKHPTPHSIMDILGWKGPIRKVSPSPLVSEPATNKHTVPYLLQSLNATKQDNNDDQPLDLCISKPTPHQQSTAVDRVYEKHLEEGMKVNFGFVVSKLNDFFFQKPPRNRSAPSVENEPIPRTSNRRFTGQMSRSIR